MHDGLEPEHCEDTKDIHTRSSDTESDEFYVFTASNSHVSSHLPYFNLSINDAPITVLADSGASINLIPMSHLDKMKPKPHLEKCSTKVFSYASKTPVPIVGKFNAFVQSANQTCNTTFHAVENSDVALISWKTSQELGLLAHANIIQRTIEVKLDMKSQYPKLFQGLGKLNDTKIKLHIDPNVQPEAQKHRRVPFHTRKQLEIQLDKDLKNDVIEPATGPTPWVSPLVIVPKPKQPGSVRVCVDMRRPNEAIKRERHATPTISEITTLLNGATKFSKLDLNQGYNQIEIEESSRYITTFSTHKGLFRYKRLSFGINSAAEMFQNTIRQCINGLEGAINISDDILVFGNSDAEHDNRLHATLRRLQDKGLTLNYEKCEIHKQSIEFLGHIFSKDDMKPSPQKIQAIVELPPPKSASEVRSLLGMLNFCGSKFIKDYATLTHPMRKLTQRDVKFEWTKQHDQALNKIKEYLQTDLNLSYFDPSKESHVYVDASPVGLSAVLVQMNNSNMKIIQVASKSLTSVEQRYSQTEREALAITWACEHLHIYLYGNHFTIHTDHKPLLTIFGNPKAKLPLRIERWVMRTQGYDMTVVFQTGAENPADYLSRHPTTHNKSSREEKIAEEYVNFVVNNSTPKSMTL